MTISDCKCCGNPAELTRGLCARCFSPVPPAPLSWYFTFGSRFAPGERERYRQDKRRPRF